MYVLAEYTKGEEFKNLMIRITGNVVVNKTLEEAKEQLKNAMIPDGSVVKILELTEIDY